MSALKAGRELDALVGEKVIGEVEANAPCDDGMTRTDTFYGPTLADCDEQIRKGYARHVERGMKLWSAGYVGPEYSTDIAAAWMVVEKVGGAYQLMRFSAFETPWWRCQFGVAPETDYVEAESAPLAICLAALETVAA